MINEAFLFSLNIHKEQFRKDGAPYISHPVETALILAQNGADDLLICAGLLHDTIEDGSVSEYELAEKFPPEVVKLVMLDSEDKSQSWENRKEAVLTSLRQSDSRQYKMLICADKLSNLRSIEKQKKLLGDNVWDMFKRPKEKQEWFYRGLASVLAPIEDLPMYSEFTDSVNRIFKKEGIE